MVGKKRLGYEVPGTINHITYRRGFNDIIFKELGIGDKYQFCSEAYGYEAKEGVFPECKEGDTEALQRVINALKKECIKYNVSHPLPQQFKVGDKVRVRHREFDYFDYRFCFGEEKAMKEGLVFTVTDIEKKPKLRGLREQSAVAFVPDDSLAYTLDGNSFYRWSSGMLEKVSEAECPRKDTLKEGDTVTFKVGDRVLTYTVQIRYLFSDSGANEAIFTLLGLDRVEFCSKYYGYHAIGGSWKGNWPECKDNDYEALTRVVNALQEECRKYNLSYIEKKEPSHDGKKNPVGVYLVPAVIDAIINKIGQIQSQEKEVKLTIKKTKYRF